MKKILPWILCLALFAVSACQKPTSYPGYPILTAVDVSSTVLNIPSSLSVGGVVDTITIHFTDGEGGLGPPTGTQDTASGNVPCTQHSYDASVINNPAYNVFWYEYQQGPDSCIDRLATAYVPSAPKYSSISGTIQIYPSIACPPVGNSDTVYFSVFIKDRYGKISNRVRTSGIIVNCQ